MDMEAPNNQTTPNKDNYKGSRTKRFHPFKKVPNWRA